MSEQSLTHAATLQDVCNLLDNAAHTIMVVCKQVVENKISPELALLKIHAGTLPTIIRANNNVSWVKGEIYVAEKPNKEGDNKQ